MVKFSRSDSFRRHLESGICKQNEDDEQSEDEPSENSESQDDHDDISSSEEDELQKSQSEIRKSTPCDTVIQQAYDSLQDTFDEIGETYLEQQEKDIWLIKFKLHANVILIFPWPRTNGKISWKKTQSTNKLWLQPKYYDLKMSTI